MTAAVYMAAMGPDGLRQVATQCMSKAKYAASKISEIPGFELQFKGEFFHEFLTKCPRNPDEIMAKLAKEGILGGHPVRYPLGLDPIAGDPLIDDILWCVTEMNTKEEIDHLVALLKNV